MMRKVLHWINVVFSWVLLFAAVTLFFYCLGEVRAAKETGQEAYVLGYRPIMILTGSMEPTIRTKGIAISKEVVGPSEIDIGDIVSFHVTQEDGSVVRVTHRIVNIDSRGIQTKGDNNSVIDPYYLTIDNIESKVVFIMNWTAILIEIWSTTSGKIWICSVCIGTLLLYMSLKLLIKSFKLHKSNKRQLKLDDSNEGFNLDLLDSFDDLSGNLDNPSDDSNVGSMSSIRSRSDFNHGSSEVLTMPQVTDTSDYDDWTL